VWETINSLKKDRVVVLTTHNMEEADFLGDTIMIMHGGRGGWLASVTFLRWGHLTVSLLLIACLSRRGLTKLLQCFCLVLNLSLILILVLFCI
jgi:ABC-type uncharacterized transport system ATPase subunit